MSDLELLSAELGALVVTGRKLTASQERRRRWLSQQISALEAERDRQIAERNETAGLEDVVALRRDWIERGAREGFCKEEL